MKNFLIGSTVVSAALISIGYLSSFKSDEKSQGFSKDELLSKAQVAFQEQYTSKNNKAIKALAEASQEEAFDETDFSGQKWARADDHNAGRIYPINHPLHKSKPKLLVDTGKPGFPII